MVQLDYDALRAEPLQTDPFPNIVVPRFVPNGDLPGIQEDLPSITKGGSFPIQSVRAGPRFQALVALLNGIEFRNAIAEKFQVDLTDAPTMATLRGWSRAKDGRIHHDTPSKHISMLLYLNDETEPWQRHEGCLRLLRSPDDIEDYTTEIRPTDGTLLAFLNGPAAWHGYRSFVGQRYVMQFHYMTSDAAARQELRRHRISAFVKRLAGAA